MQNLEWYLADLKSTGKNTIATVEKSLTDMFIRLVRIYPCLFLLLLWADTDILFIVKITAQCSRRSEYIVAIKPLSGTLHTETLSPTGTNLRHHKTTAL